MLFKCAKISVHLYIVLIFSWKSLYLTIIAWKTTLYDTVLKSIARVALASKAADEIRITILKFLEIRKIK
jgi:hypothetical protein